MRTNKSKVKLGIVGLGDHMVDVLIPAMFSIGGLEVVGTYSSSQEKFSQVQKKYFGIGSFFKDWQQLILEEPLDAVVVASNPSFHYEVTSFALKNKKSVFVEKPMVTSSKEAEAILGLISKHKKSVVVDYNYQRSLLWQKTLSKIESLGSDIGLVEFESPSTRPKKLQFNFRHLYENGLWVLAIHPIHQMFKLLGMPLSVNTVLNFINPNLFTSFHLFYFRHNIALVSWSNYKNQFSYKVKVHTRDGSIIENINFSQTVVSDCDKKNISSESISTLGSSYDVTGYAESFRVFRDCVLKDESYKKDVQDTIYVSKIIETMISDYDKIITSFSDYKYLTIASSFE